MRSLWPSASAALASKKWSLVLGYLVATDQIDLRIAIRLPEASDAGLYHEKFGLLELVNGTRIGFVGSANETAGGLFRNFERLEYFASWQGGDSNRRIQSLSQDFERLLENRTPGLTIVSLLDAVRRGLLRERPEDFDASDGSPMSGTVAELLVPPAVRLWPHQTAAVRAWADAGGRGILEMATASGKTLTALFLASRVYDRVGPGLAIIIVAPLIHLIDQWITEATRFGLRPVRCAEDQEGWREQFDSGIFALNSAQRPVLSVAVTTATMIGRTFQSLCDRIRKPILLIADEVHNCGASRIASALPANAQLRLGLSATPDRWFDPAGTKRIHDYFGPTVFSYGLDEAIRDGILTPYRYYPEVVEFSSEELDVYIELSATISRFWNEESENDIPESVRILLLKRARLVASAEAKLPRLRKLLERDTTISHVLVYCGDGSVEGPEAGEMIRQVEAATRMIGSDLSMRCAPYTAATPARERQRLVTEFADGGLQVLVAIRCLDEGVDIPSARRAFILASSTNPRQFIQRRGRLLRRAEGKDRADIYDFYVVPPLKDLSRGTKEWQAGRSLMRSQLRRAREFADASINAPTARRELVQLADRFDALSAWGEE